jgi:hypothetical protein
MQREQVAFIPLFPTREGPPCEACGRTGQYAVVVSADQPTGHEQVLASYYYCERHEREARQRYEELRTARPG